MKEAAELHAGSALQKTRRPGDGADAGDQQPRDSSDDGDELPQAQQGRAMVDDAGRPYRRAAPVRGVTTRGRMQMGAEAASYAGGQPREERQTAMYGEGFVSRPRPGRFQDELRMAQEWQERPYAQESRHADDDKEHTDTSRDPSMENGDSSGNSLEAQQWSDTEGSQPLAAQTQEVGGDNSRAVPCRVSWCDHPGKRYGLCWAHGGVKKCCHRNCPKIALATGEFCSIHEREISATTF